MQSLPPPPKIDVAWYQQKRDSLAQWDRDKREALALKNAVPWWPPLLFGLAAAGAPWVGLSEAQSSLLAALAAGWLLSVGSAHLRSERRMRRADRQLAADDARIGPPPEIAGHRTPLP